MADKQSTKPARGTRDFLPDDIRRREYVVGIVRDVYQRYGFEPLETPAFENIETLIGKYGEEGNQLIFKILKRGEHEKTGEADLALRYDLTVPLARVVAEYQGQLPTLFKRYQIQPVWRADRPARGRFREFYQCDIDSTGSTSPVVEVDLCSAVTDVLEALTFSQFQVKVNHRQILTGILEKVGLTAERHETALVALDKLEKIGISKVHAELIDRGIDHEVATMLVEFFEQIRLSYRPLTELAQEFPGRPYPPEILQKFNFNIFSDLQNFIGGTVAGARGLKELGAILELSQGTAFGRHAVLDVSLARGLSYYTGAIMEIAVEGIGSLGGGGRYDNLVGMFLGRDVPACGFSLGLERIIVVMTERNMFPPTPARGSVDVLVICLVDPSEAETLSGARADALRLAGELRAAGLRVDVFPDASRKFDKPLKYASARGARVMAIFGENEVKAEQASIRDLETREQQTVPRDEAAAAIARLLT